MHTLILYVGKYEKVVRQEDGVFQPINKVEMQLFIFNAGDTASPTLSTSTIDIAIKQTIPI